MKRLYRSGSDRKLAGIAGGIAEYFNVDPTLIPLFVAGIFFTSGAFILIYIISIFIIPNEWEVK